MFNFGWCLKKFQQFNFWLKSDLRIVSNLQDIQVNPNDIFILKEVGIWLWESWAKKKLHLHQTFYCCFIQMYVMSRSNGLWVDIILTHQNGKKIFQIV